jgi:predicted membrane metal-binding protein
MKLKQFLKPEWRKIVLYAILLFLSLSGHNFLLKYNFLLWILSVIDAVNTYTIIITICIYNYLLSCLVIYLIVWIYDKVRKKK